MNLLALRTEVLASGFDQSQYSARINQYLNDGLARVARKVDYYGDVIEAPFTTAAGQAVYPWPANLARIDSVLDTTNALNQELQYVGPRDIDRSPAQSAEPRFYAIDGPNLRLYPTPDQAYSLSLRYWQMPPALVNDTDVPIIPADYHHMLISYALWQCYEREDDPQMAGYHEQQFEKFLAQFATDVNFPTSEEPSQVRGMWDREEGLGRPGWSLYGGYAGY